MTFSSAYVPVTCVSESLSSFFLIRQKKARLGELYLGNGESHQPVQDTNSGTRILKLLVCQLLIIEQQCSVTICNCPEMAERVGRMEGSLT